MNIKSILRLGYLFSILMVVGCSGVDTFGTAARSGDTVALTLGWNQGLSRSTINSITVTDSLNAQTIYGPQDAALRSVFNSYPDPVSTLVVKSKINPNNVQSILIEGNITDGDKDYSETVMVLDLPQGMATGTATIIVSTASGALPPLEVQILSGAGESNDFANHEFLAVLPNHLKSLERAENYTVTFQGGTIPHAIQIDMLHDPDQSSGGTGIPHVANPRGDLKSINWSDDGARMTVILMPTDGQTLSDMVLLKFHVAGGLQNLVLDKVQGYDINGVDVPGLTAQIN